MNGTLPTYTAQMDALRHRLAAALDARTDWERELIQWLRDSLGADSLVAFVTMAERVSQR